ncbi:7016_t:CDS:2, partial [Entrophospora sp. SA101]
DIIDPEEDDFVPARRNNPPGRKLFNPYANKPKDIWQEQSPSSYQTDRHRGFQEEPLLTSIIQPVKAMELIKKLLHKLK